MANKAKMEKAVTYREFLERSGRWREGLMILGFSFREENQARLFHSRILNAHVGHTAVQVVGERCIVCIPEGRVAECVSMAEKLDGRRFKVTTIL